MDGYGRLFKELRHEIRIHHLGDEGRVGRSNLCKRYEHGIERSVCSRLVVGHVAAPETVAAAANVPVGEYVGKFLNGARTLGYLIAREVLVDELYEAVEFGEYPLVHQRELAVF